MPESMIQKPFLKWLGGKTQIIDKIISNIPCKMVNYHEIFLGGGSVLFAILSLRKQNKISITGEIFAYDLNEHLIDVYKAIQTKKDEFFIHLNKLRNIYHGLEFVEKNMNPQTYEEALTSKESYYYWIRSEFNKINKMAKKTNATNEINVEKCAMFVFLNKTCFRGMYREGPNGFNVPYGHYKSTPTFMTQDELNKISELIQSVHFICCDFKTSLSAPKSKDFMYLDPPYAPETKKSFVGYTENGFDLQAHKDLFNMIREAHVERTKFLLSNAWVELVIENFRDFEMEEIKARRAINSKKPDSTTSEILIRNYKLLEKQE
jgi:DNA adenine methylase